MSREANIVAAQEAKVADLRKNADEAVRAADMEEAVLRGMKLMMGQDTVMGSLFSPPAPPDQAGVGLLTRRGRQPGAISHEWRNTLGSLYESAHIPFSSAEVLVAAHANGLMKVRLREAEDRIRAYLDFGYVERAGSGFKVSDLAVQKYGFVRLQTAEAPTADAVGAS